MYEITVKKVERRLVREQEWRKLTDLPQQDQYGYIDLEKEKEVTDQVLHFRCEHSELSIVELMEFLAKQGKNE